MPNFQVFNEQGKLIIDDTVKNIGVVRTDVIGTLPMSQPPLTYNLDVAAPSWYPSPNTDRSMVLQLTPITGAVPLTIIKPNNGAYGAGREVFSKNCGTLYHLRGDYVVESGYLDVRSSNGQLLWSAKTAEKIPRVTKVFDFTYAQLNAGITVNIGDGLFMLNNFFGSFDINPGHTGTTRSVFGLFWMLNNGILRLQIGVDSPDTFGSIEAVKMYGWKLYVYKFAS